MAAAAQSIFRLGLRSFCASAHRFASKPLPYRGVLVSLADADVPSFASRLALSLADWRREGLNSAMLRIPIELSALAAAASREGFVFHHAEGSHAYLKCWLHPSKPDKVPPFATHQVGVAGFVVNQRRELLVVKEWRDADHGNLKAGEQWKLPGGLLDRGESFGEGATREVLEETGVRTSFRSLLTFWHRHALTWSQSDLYVVARLEPEDAGELRAQQSEISDVRWMHLEEFVQTQDHPLILAILSRLYGLEPGAGGARSRTARTEGDALPSVEMVEDAVRFPNREPFPTYFPIARRERLV